MFTTMKDLMTDREQMVWLNRAHLQDDDYDDPRDWSMDE